jgi:hypothetical protein
LPAEFSLLASLRRFAIHDSGWAPPFADIVAITSQMDNLNDIRLVGNRISGTIPKDVKISPNLGILDLQTNLLTGSIPTTIALNSGLRVLSVNNNLLTGSILPTEIGSLTNLLSLLAGSSSLDANLPLPSEIGSLNALALLFLELVPFEIPTQLGLLTALRDLTITPASTVLSEIGLLTNLKTMKMGDEERAWDQLLMAFLLNGMSRKQLSNTVGALPSTIGQLSALRSLEVWGDFVAGPIPSEIGRLSNLDTLFIWISSISGSGPAYRPLGNSTAAKSDRFYSH